VVAGSERTVSLADLFRIFIKVGLSFGAGTGMSAVLQEELVSRREAMPRGEFMAIFGLARLVPSGSMTALAVAVGYRYQGWAGTFVALGAMILPGFALTLALTIGYTLLAGSRAFRVINLTLTPAALAIVIVAAWSLGREYMSPSLELVLIVASAVAVLIFDLNPSVVLLAGGAIGAVAIGQREDPA
jgi:chromate transporter